jgi:hypothetical protein
VKNVFSNDMTETLRALKARNEIRLEGEKKLIDRKRNLLTLIAKYLQDSGYIESSQKVQNEAGISLSKYNAADNVDLLGIMIDFEEAYRIKFGKSVKLVRKITYDDENNSNRSVKSVLKKKLENVAMIGIVTLATLAVVVQTVNPVLLCWVRLAVALIIQDHHHLPHPQKHQLTTETVVVTRIQ